MSYVEMETKLHSLSRVGGETISGLTPAQTKKELRKSISVENSTKTLGFLHAALVNINGKNLLIAGPSGIGKNCYINHISESDAVIRLASDWVSIENDNGQLYTSDLNYPDKITHPDRIHLDGLMFLTYNNCLDRDAYAPNKTELIEILKETFDTATPLEFEKLVTFWITNYELLPNISVIPARRSNETSTLVTIRSVLERFNPTNQKYKIGIIGIGSVGAPLAYALGSIDCVSEINLFDTDIETKQGIALDLGQAFSDKTITCQDLDNPQDIFQKSDIVLFVFRDMTAVDNKMLPERWHKSARHLDIIEQYACLAGETDFTGSIFVITNPVDILTYATYKLSQQTSHPLRTFQVFGIGLQLDAMRAIYYGKKLYPNISQEDIELFGNHSDILHIGTALPSDLHNELVSKIMNASAEIRSHIPRTIYGPVQSSIQTLKSYLYHGSSYATLIQEGTFMGRKVSFRGRLPMIDQISSNSIKEYDRILEKNRESITIFGKTG
jgi:malate/lactate dehydrogenase